MAGAFPAIFVYECAMTDNYYPPISPLKSGLAGKCPRCGRGKFFAGFLKVAKKCNACGLDFSFADAGDGAAWFVMLFTCVFGVGSILGVEIAYSPAMVGPCTDRHSCADHRAHSVVAPDERRAAGPAMEHERQ